MSDIFIVEDGSGKEDSNSYVSEAYASTYFDGHSYSDEWPVASSAVQKTALITSTRLLDEWVDWNGDIVSDTQALRFPRYGVQTRDRFTFDSDIVPEFLKRATCELALYLLRSNTTAEPDTKGFSELKAGSLMMKIDKLDRDGTGALPDAVMVIVEPFGSIRRRGGAGTVELERH